MSYIDLIWGALEGGLGAEKTAYLKHQPLDEIVRNKIAHDHGVEVGPNITLGDAVGTLGISWRKKKAQHRVIQDGITALKSVLPADTEKTASEAEARLYPRDASTFHKISAAYKLRRLAPLARGDGAEKIAALQQQVDEDIVESLKKEARLSAISKHPAARNMGKGLAVGAGAAAPLGVGAYMTGSALSDRFTEDARNRALETAAGVGAIGTGVYGIGRGIDHMLEQRGADRNYERMLNHQRQLLADQQRMLGKQASVNENVETDFKTAIYIDSLLENVEQNEKVAEVRALNREYAVNLLCEAHTKEAQQTVGVPVDRPTTNLERGLARAVAGVGGMGAGGAIGALSSQLTGADPLVSGLVGAGIGGIGGALIPPPKSQPAMLSGTPEELLPLFSEQPGDAEMTPEEQQRIESIRDMLTRMQ